MERWKEALARRQRGNIGVVESLKQVNFYHSRISCLPSTLGRYIILKFFEVVEAATLGSGKPFKRRPVASRSMLIRPRSISSTMNVVDVALLYADEMMRQNPWIRLVGSSEPASYHAKRRINPWRNASSANRPSTSEPVTLDVGKTWYEGGIMLSLADADLRSIEEGCKGHTEFG